MGSEKDDGNDSDHAEDQEVEVVVHNLLSSDIADGLGIVEDDGSKHRKDNDDHLQRSPHCQDDHDEETADVMDALLLQPRIKTCPCILACLIRK